MHIASLKEVVSAEEWKLRCDLAACYRLVAAYGWSDLVFTHISARIPRTNTRALSLLANNAAWTNMKKFTTIVS